MAGSLPPDALPSVRLAGPAEAAQVPENLCVNGNVPSWDTATRKLTRLVEYFEDEQITHEAVQYDIFTESWAQAAWKQLYDIDRVACEWAEQTVLVIFTGNYFLDSERETHIPPVTFFDRLQAASDARQKALSRALSDLQQWQSIRVVGTGTMGYPILILGLYLSEHRCQETFAPIVYSHVANCPIAGSDAHHPQKAISVYDSDDEDNQPSAPSKLVHVLGRYVPGLKSGSGITDESPQRRGTAAVLRGGQWRAYRFGQH